MWNSPCLNCGYVYCKALNTSIGAGCVGSPTDCGEQSTAPKHNSSHLVVLDKNWSFIMISKSRFLSIGSAINGSWMTGSNTVVHTRVVWSQVRWILPRFLKRSTPKTDLFFRGSSFKPWWNSHFHQHLREVWDRKIVKCSLFFSPLIIVCIEILFSNLYVKMSSSSQHLLPWWSNNLHDNFLFKQHRRISSLNAHGKL